MVFLCSISVLDPFLKLNDIETLFSLQQPVNLFYYRLKSDGHISAQLSNEDVLSPTNQFDTVPAPALSMIDFAVTPTTPGTNPQPILPLEWPTDPASVVVVEDPEDVGENPAFDIRRIEYASILNGPTIDSPLLVFR